MRLVISAVCGLIFGIGLILSGMTSPAKVQAFLDISGLWDPSLALVMGGAIGVAFPFFARAKKQGCSPTGEPMRMPSETRIDRKLLIGAALFGIGWGLGGFCPGPALVGVGALQWPALVFVLAMLVGMAVWHQVER